MDTEIKVLMEKIADKQNKIDLQQDTINRRLDTHEDLISNIRVELSRNSQQQQVLIDSMGEFREEIREMVIRTIERKLSELVKKVISTEIRLLSRRNPKRVIERTRWPLETIKDFIINLFKHDKNETKKVPKKPS